MFCTQCGTANSEQVMFCTNCSAPLVKPGEDPRTRSLPGSGQNPSPYSPPSSGQQQYPQQPYQPYQPYPGYRSAASESQAYQPYPSSYANQIVAQQGSASGRAIASMIMSIVSPFTCGPILSIPGLILGKMEMNAIREGQAPRAGESFAKIGFYLGIVVTALSCIGFVVWMLVAFGTAIGSIP